MSDRIEFAHEKLQVYRKAHAFVAATTTILAALPRGEAELKDQLRRASDSVLLNIAEGAGRTSRPDKGRFYSYARGSACECAAVLDLFELRRLAEVAAVHAARAALYEVVCMLTALARNSRARAG